ncbi:iron chelate uptake ABC transporter family permease subunit [Agrobacterium sp.]|jgi:ABC-type Fe3+-siderophore transport system permease subunit|uniref:iron chelate uptake ABC transporter family permease subunit n=1 Tax=Agrobacterium sp. TaxID=361 RepID=UPI0028AF817B|nr:iron chelate uptake ABC transporter family permease subunit [Agrobacterium sp.]
MSNRLFSSCLPAFISVCHRCRTIVVGDIAFALPGALMPALTRNPLAESGIMGIYAGAAFAMVVAMVFLVFQVHCR